MPENKSKPGEAALKMGAHFMEIANAPLKRQGTSDAWNERQNRLAAGRDGIRLLLRGTLEKNLAGKASGPKSSK